MDLRHKDLRGANLEWADLTEADLRDARLCGANLHGAYLTGAQLDGADLSGALLDDTYLLTTNFGHAVLNGATFEHAIWDQGTTWPPGFVPPRADIGNWRGRRQNDLNVPKADPMLLPQRGVTMNSAMKSEWAPRLM